MTDRMKCEGRWEAYPVDKDRCLYICLDDPMDVKFLYHNKTDEEGYGGREFELTLKSGRTIVIKGPWSSNHKTVKEITGIDLEPYYVEVGRISYEKHRLVGLVACDKHEPFCEDPYHMLGEREFYAMGFCRKCGKGIYGLYSSKGELIGEGGPNASNKED